MEDKTGKARGKMRKVHKILIQKLSQQLIKHSPTNHLKGTNMYTKLWTEICTQEESLLFLSSKTEKKNQQNEG